MGIDRPHAGGKRDDVFFLRPVFRLEAAQSSATSAAPAASVPPLAPTVSEKSIAVLPFDSFSGTA